MIHDNNSLCLFSSQSCFISSSTEERGLNSTYLAITPQVTAEKIIKTMHLAPPLNLKIHLKAPLEREFSHLNKLMFGTPKVRDTDPVQLKPHRKSKAPPILICDGCPDQDIGYCSQNEEVKRNISHGPKTLSSRLEKL